MFRFALCLFALAAFILTGPAVAQVAPKAQAVKKKDAKKKDGLVNVNTATASELTELHGVGKKKAARIVADRKENGPFRSLDDLQRVKGIGPKTVAKNRPRMTVGKVKPGKNKVQPGKKK